MDRGERITLSGRDLAHRHHAALLADGRLRSIVDWRSWYATWWLPAFGDVADVRDIDNRVLNAWLKARRLDRPPLSPNGLRKVFSLLSSLLEFGVRLNALERNACRDVDRSLVPKKAVLAPERGPLSVLRVAELRRLFGLAPTPSPVLFWDRLFFAASAVLGHRYGEMAALNRADWKRDLAPLSGVAVTKQVATKRGSVVEETTKDGHSKYTPVSRYLVALLDQVPDRFAEQAGRPWEPTDPLFPFFPESRPDHTRRWNQRTALRRYHETCAACGIIDPLTGPRTVHSLRHTFVTRLRAAGADPSAVRWFTHPGTVRAERLADSHLHYNHALDWESLCRAVALFDLSEPDQPPEPVQLGLNLWSQP